MKRFLSLLILLAVTLSLLVSCGGIEECMNHTDADGDGNCESCGSAVTLPDGGGSGDGTGDNNTGNGSGDNDGDDNTGNGDGNTGNGDDNTGNGDDNTGSGDDNTGNGDDNTGSGDDNTGSGDGNTGNGDDNTGSGDDNTGSGDGNTGSSDDNTGSGDGNTGNGDGNTGSGDDNTDTYLYTDFTAEDKALFDQYVGTRIPFIPTNEYYLEIYLGAEYGMDYDFLNFYTFGNTEAEFDAFLDSLSDWTPAETYEDTFGATWYVYDREGVTVEAAYYETEGGYCIDVYISAPVTDDDNTGSGDDNTGSDDGNTGSGDGNTEGYLYTDFSASDKALFDQYIGTLIPFIPNNEYALDLYLGADYDLTYDILNFYTYGNTQADFEAFLESLTGWTLMETYEDDYGDTWYYYGKDAVEMEAAYYETEGGYCIDVYIYGPDSASGDGNTGSGDDNTGSGDGNTEGYLYTDFSASDKALFDQYIGTLIPFIPNNEYALDLYLGADYDLTYDILNFYTYGNTQADFEAFLESLTGWTLMETYEDDYGDTWYYYGKDAVEMEAAYYETEGGYCIDVYIYGPDSASGDGNTGSGDDNTGSGDVQTNATITFDDTANRVSFSEQEQVWEMNGITVTNRKDSATSNVADYAAPVRLYKNSTLIVAYPGMTKLVFTCSGASYATALSDALSMAGITASVDDKTVTVTFSTAQDTFSVVLAGGQVRLDSIEVQGGSASSGGSDSGSAGGSTDGTDGYLYTDFSASDKALFEQYIGAVIPFAPTNEYGIEGYYDVDDYEHGIYYYTVGNTQSDFTSYLIKYSSWTPLGTYEDDFGDLWYCYQKADVIVDFSFYTWEGENYIAVYVYSSLSTDLEDGSGSGSGSSDNYDHYENDGVGLPTDADGVFDVLFTDATYVKDVTDQGYYLDGCPTTGSPAVLVIPVEFSDAPASDYGYSTDVIVDAFLGTGDDTDYFSVYEYYYLSSYGDLTLDITVIDEWFRPRYSSSYYANATLDDGSPIGEQIIMDEALAYLSTVMDLSAFDSDGNGIIDAVVLVNTLDVDSNSDFQWAFRSWNFYTDDEGYCYEYDGVSANDYLWASYQFLYETYDADGDPLYEDSTARNTYTFIHEFAHILGVDDYYDTTYESEPMEGCDVMDSMPGDHNAFTKFNLGWLTASRLVVAEGSITLTLEDFSKNGDTILIANNWDEDLGAYQEYYVLVYYTNNGLNAGDYGYFSRDGVVVYHVNASLFGEDYEGEYYYDIYNTNTSPSDPNYGTENNLIEYVKSSAGNFTYVAGDTLPTVTLDGGETLVYTFTVDSLTADTATITFTFVG